VASQLGVFRLSPWAIAVYPAILGVKGVIEGLLTGRLSTALHLGTIYPRFSKNTKSFRKLLETLVVVTLATAVMMSLISMGFGTLFWKITVADFPSIMSVVVATMAVGLSLTLLTTKVAFVSFQRGSDLDMVVYPIMSTIADIFVTVCYVLVLTLFFSVDFGKWLIFSIAIGFVLFALFIVPGNIREPEFLRPVKESIATMLSVAFIVNVTGTVLKGISEVVGSRREIYTVYPVMIDMVGDVGLVVGSTATTKLALGLLKPSFSSIRNHAKNIFSAWSGSIVLFLILAIASLLLNGIVSLPALSNLLLVLLAANLLSVGAIALVSYGISILTFKRGLDPDNFVIPIESSLADSVASIALLVVLILVG